MLVTFECKAYANITYFGDIAKQLLRMMGQSGNVPGAILADDVQKALTRLQAALAHQSGKRLPETATEPQKDQDEPVPIAHRALPLLELLAAASKEKCDVMWR